ncbi:hypothetical protein BT63DRAFT_415704 [Microthyrium microscopicum]|uniref:Uncharacterized protein n=1 Tax=Microthyrium microscopicum TaxID=703497 RepID=A0A6A6U649_9PEZI|nr:hypothetical protein BT63DRAFT_415704 [Microthyrium microscopicum]
MNTLLRPFHRALGLPSQSSTSWYRARLREELEERRQATTFWHKISETSDVLYTISRAEYDGHHVRNLPPFSVSRHTLPYAYMVGKFTSRRIFYRTSAMLCGAPKPHLVREVVNPIRDIKLEQVASRHGINPDKFKHVGHQLLKVWPLLP